MKVVDCNFRNKKSGVVSDTASKLPIKIGRELFS
jgi:hypothetical protein